MFQLAWRNLWRNRTRTAITGTAIALTLAIQLMNYGIADSMYSKLISSATRASGGNILVHQKGYWDARTTDLVISDYLSLKEQLSEVAGVKSMLTRVTLTGLLSSTRSNTGVELLGINAKEESAVKDWSKYVESPGQWVDAKDVKSPIVLGKQVVADLKLELGDRVVMVATDPEGEITRAGFNLVGVLDTGSKVMDSSAAFTSLEAAQRAGNFGATVTTIALLLENDEARQTVKSSVLSAIGQRSSELEVLTWDEAMPELVSFIKMDRQMNEKFGIFLFLVVAFGIANTILMAVLERVREVGLLSALGMTPARIGRLILTESLLLASVFTAIGTALGYGIHRLIAANGINYGEMSGQSDMELSGVLMEDLILYSDVVPMRWVMAASVVVLLVVASALYPAWKATRMEPATAMRTYE